MSARKNNIGYLTAGIALGCAFLLFAYLVPSAPRMPESAPSPPKGFSSSALHVLFEPNVGQATEGVDFVARGAETVLVSASGISTPSFRQRLVGANPESAATGKLRASSVSNYFLGNDPAAWKTGVANFGAVAYRDVYPSVDLEYASAEGRLNYQFTVQPGGDPAAIALSLEGADSVTVEVDRISAEAASGSGVFAWENLRAFQKIGGREVAVAVAFERRGDSGYGFRVGAYDPSHPLMIDPTLELEFSTFLGGSSSGDSALDVTLDAQRNIYVGGRTTSTDFPVSAAYQGANAGGQDAYLVKLNPDASAIVWSTYFGGSGSDQVNTIVRDASGNIYVSGTTDSTNLPTLNAYQAARAGSRDFFVAKFNPTASALSFSTYLGGTGTENFASAMALDASANVYVSGSVASTNFPTLNPFQGSHAGGGNDAVVAKFSSSGSLLYSTYFGGNGNDSGYVTVDDVGNMYLSGSTNSTNFPTLNPYQGSLSGGFDAFLVQLNLAGSALVFGTYLGGTGNEQTLGQPFLGPDGTVYTFGFTESTDFPTVNPFQASNAGVATRDYFVSRFSSDGSALLFSTYFGGNAGDNNMQQLWVGGGGAITILGQTVSTNMPVLNGFQSSFAGGAADGYFARFVPGEATVRFGTYLGGTGSDIPSAFEKVPGEDSFVVVGSAGAASFPTTPSVVQPTISGTSDGFVSKIVLPASGGTGDFQTPQIRLAKSAEPSALPEGAGEVTFTYTMTNPGFPPLYDVSIADDRCSPLVFVGGDYNGDGQLQSYDQWTYACTVTVSQTTTNIATAVGYANGIRAEASAEATVEVGSSLVETMVEGLRAFINLQTGCRFFAEEARLPSQVNGSPEHPDLLCPGDFITTPSFRTVYYVTREFVRRPFFNALVFLTHQNSFQGVKTVTDATLLTLRLGDLMTPKAGTVLVKFQGDSLSVYALFENPADPFMPIARILETEEAARANFGPDWAGFVIDLPPTMFDHFVHGAPINGAEEIDPSRLLRRRDLEAVTNPYTFALMRKVVDLLHEVAR